MISPRITRVSATLQLLAGLALLFAADNVLALIAPGIPPSANWIGQVVGGALIALAVMNWLDRTALLARSARHRLIATSSRSRTSWVPSSTNASTAAAVSMTPWSTT